MCVCPRRQRTVLTVLSDRLVMALLKPSAMVLSVMERRVAAGSECDWRVRDAYMRRADASGVQCLV
jgi:hypothetical protein